MILTATPSLWTAMQALPLACRFGAAPPELRALHGMAAASSGADDDRFLDDLHAALAGLPDALKERVDPLLLGVFYLDGLGACLVTDVIDASNGATVGALLGTLVAIDTDALRDVATRRSPVRSAALRYLLAEAFERVLALRRPALCDT